MAIQAGAVTRNLPQNLLIERDGYLTGFYIKFISQDDGKGKEPPPLLALLQNLHAKSLFNVPIPSFYLCSTAIFLNLM